MVFDSRKCKYVSILFGDMIIEGTCTYWNTCQNDSLIRLIIDGKQYITSVNNVLFEESPDEKE